MLKPEPSKEDVKIVARFEREDGNGYKEMCHSVTTWTEAVTIVAMLMKQPDCIHIYVIRRLQYDSQR